MLAIRKYSVYFFFMFSETCQGSDRGRTEFTDLPTKAPFGK